LQEKAIKKRLIKSSAFDYFFANPSNIKEASATRMIEEIEIKV